MESLEYIQALTRVVLGVMAVGITAKCIYICFKGISDEEEPKEILQKVKKEIIVLLFAVCLKQFASILIGFWQ